MDWEDRAELGNGRSSRVGVIPEGEERRDLDVVCVRKRRREKEKEHHVGTWLVVKPTFLEHLTERHIHIAITSQSIPCDQSTVEYE